MHASVLGNRRAHAAISGPIRPHGYLTDRTHPVAGPRLSIEGQERTTKANGLGSTWAQNGPVDWKEGCRAWLHGAPQRAENVLALAKGPRMSLFTYTLKKKMYWLSHVKMLQMSPHLHLHLYRMYHSNLFKKDSPPRWAEISFALGLHARFERASRRGRPPDTRAWPYLTIHTMSYTNAIQNIAFPGRALPAQKHARALRKLHEMAAMCMQIKRQ